MTPEKTRLAIGVATRNRPEMLGRMLDSLSRLDRPENTDFIFVVVENDKEASVEGVVREFRDKTPWATTDFDLEPRLGIPFARNRILDSAMEQECDFLAMLDDDETADPGWISGLLEEQKRNGLDLLGGPVRIEKPPSSLNFLQRMIYRGLVSRARRVERKARLACRFGRGNKIPVFTNNWCCRLSFLKKNGIRFDEGLAFSGGSDKDLFRRIQECGGATGWAPGAFVSEEIPESRLTPAYQYLRGRDSTISHFRMRTRGKNFVFPRAILFSAAKVSLGLLRLLLVPLTGGRTYVLAMRAFGCAAGRLQAVSGKESEHYRNVAGR